MSGRRGASRSGGVPTDGQIVRRRRRPPSRHDRRRRSCWRPQRSRHALPSNRRGTSNRRPPGLAAAQPPRPVDDLAAPASPDGGLVEPADRMKLAVVVQRYGADINGGAELHARYIAERLSRARRRARADDLCARLRHAGATSFPPAQTDVNGIAGRTVSVSARAEPAGLRRRSRAGVRPRRTRLQDELDWLDSEGPVSRGLLARLRSGRRRVRLRAALQRPLPPRLPRRARRAGRRRARADGGARAGARARIVRADLPRRARHHVQLARGARADPGRRRQRARARRRRRRRLGDSAQVIGRARAADVRPAATRSSSTSAESTRTRGAPSCSTSSSATSNDRAAPSTSCSIGTPVLPIPAHPRIRHLGYVSDRDKFDAIAAAEALVMPSYYESLSMVALEAWALAGRCRQRALRRPGRPVPAQQRGPVLCRRRASSPARSTRCSTTPALAAALGRNGRAYFERHYGWPVIERKYLDMFERLASEPPRARDGAAARLAGAPAARRCRPRPTRRADRPLARRGPVRPAGAHGVKFAFITPRYGAEITAGAEHACRLLAEQVSERHDVDVLTTCARDPLTWKNEYCRRRRTACAACWSAASPSASRTTATAFQQFSDRLLAGAAVARATSWNGCAGSGPSSPGLIDFLKRQHRIVRRAGLLLAAAMPTTVHGLADRARAQRPVSVPAAAPGAALRPLGRSARARRAASATSRRPSAGSLRAFMRRRPQHRGDRRHRHRSAAAAGVPAASAGSGRRRVADDDEVAARRRDEPRSRISTGRGIPFRRRHRLYGPFALYGGRVEPDNGCEEMLEYFDTLRRRPTATPRSC